MLKKFIAFLCIFALLISCFCLPASALGVEDFIEWYLTWFIDESHDLLDYDSESLLDYFSTPEGYQYLLTLFNAAGGPAGNLLFNPATDIMRNVVDANGHKYLSTKVKKNLLQNCVTSYNGFMSSEESGIRTLNVNNYTIDSNYNLRTDFGYVDGSPPFVGNGTTSSAISTWFHPTAFYSQTVQLYKGSDMSPPILYVPTSGAVIFHNTSLQAGYYMPLSDTELFCLGNDYRTYKSGWRYEVNSSTGKVTLYYLRNYYNYGNFKFVDCGASSGSSAYKTVNNGIYTYEYLLDKVTKSVGLYLNLKTQTAYTELPDDQYFDDDDYTVVLLPVDEPAEPIYIHPDTYNDYIITNVYNYDYDNEYVNTVVTDNDVTNIYNIYNTTDSDSSGGSSGGYDDHNLLVTLRSWFSEIVNKLNIIIGILNTPMYDDFSDVYLNVPLVGEVDQLLADFKSVVETDTDPDPPTINISMYDTDTDIDFSWYSDVAPTIKPIMSAFAYVSGVICCWLSLKSFFGINRGDDG